MIQGIIDNTVFIRSLLLVLVLLLFSSYFAQKFLLTIFPFAIFRFFIIPGVIIHELSHAFGCLITGAKVDSINVFSKEGGEVKHGEPFLKFLGPTIISMAPIACGIIVFYFWSHLMDTPFKSISQSSAIIGSVDSFISRLGQINWFSWPIWLYLYGCLNLVIVICPSAQDFSNCKWELVIIFITIGLIEYFKFFSGSNLANNIYRYFIPFILISIFFLIIVTPFYLIKKK